MTGYKELAARAEVLEAALTKINSIRDSIIGFQNVGWSEHIYPLVAALGEAGFEGVGYDEARKNVRTLLDQLEAAEARCKRLEEALNAAMGMCDQYAGFIRHRVRAADIEVHPYLPELEQVIEVARLALQENTNGG